MTRYELEFTINFAPNKPEIVGYNVPNTTLTAKLAHILRRTSANVSNGISTPYAIELIDDVIRIIKILTIHCPIIPNCCCNFLDNES